MCKQQKSNVGFYFGLNCELWFPGHVGKKKLAVGSMGTNFLQVLTKYFFQ